MTTAPPGGFSADPAAQQPMSPYGNLMAQLQGAAGALGKGGQRQKQQGGGGGGLGSPGGAPPRISLQEARKLFDPGRFYGALRSAGVRGV